MDPLTKLIAIVFVAFAVEASLGFGSALVAITLGSMLFPLEVLLPAFVPLSLAVAAYITVRYGDRVDRPMLFRRVAPAMVAGLPIGSSRSTRCPRRGRSAPWRSSSWCWLLSSSRRCLVAKKGLELAFATKEAGVSLPELSILLPCR
jgi:hypothetical protein